MDGQQEQGVSGVAGAPTVAEVAKLREFLGSHTGPGSVGSHKGAAERLDNVRPLALRRERRVREVE